MLVVGHITARRSGMELAQSVYRVLPPGDLWEAVGADFVFVGSYGDMDLAIAEARRRCAEAKGGECVVHVGGRNPADPTTTGS
jgi:hypothetical protein